jgi:hypothetical protein
VDRDFARPFAPCSAVEATPNATLVSIRASRFPPSYEIGGLSIASIAHFDGPSHAPPRGRDRIEKDRTHSRETLERTRNIFGMVGLKAGLALRGYRYLKSDANLFVRSHWCRFCLRLGVLVLISDIVIRR